MARRFLFITSCALLFAALFGNRSIFAQSKESSSSFPFDRETEKVVSDQESAKKAATRRLSEQIENAQKRLESSKLPADQVLAFRGTLKREQERFEKHGLIPFSSALRSASVDYLREQLKADVSTNLRFAELIVKWEKKLSAPQLEELKRRHSAALKPTIVARWTHQTGANRRSEIDLLSNGRIGSEDSRNYWKLSANGNIQLRWPDPAAPGGVWVDNAQLTSHGTAFRGKNQHNAAAFGELILDE